MTSRFLDVRDHRRTRDAGRTHRAPGSDCGSCRWKTRQPTRRSSSARWSGLGFDVEADRAENAAQMRAALASTTFDVIISDYLLPQFDAPGGAARPPRHRRRHPVHRGLGHDRRGRRGAHDARGRARLHPQRQPHASSAGRSRAKSRKRRRDEPGRPPNPRCARARSGWRWPSTPRSSARSTSIRRRVS